MGKITFKIKELEDRLAQAQEIFNKTVERYLAEFNSVLDITCY